MHELQNVHTASIRIISEVVDLTKYLLGLSRVLFFSTGFIRNVIRSRKYVAQVMGSGKHANFV
jgi:hypothetical protein